MIKTKPDLLMSPDRLAREMEALEAEVATRDQWRVREKYVDRGWLDPFYIIDFRAEAGDVDDLLGEPMYGTRSRAVKVKHMTRDPAADPGAYWKPVAAAELVQRLRRFLRMYRDDYLQPPGRMGGLHDAGRAHRRFPMKRFLYRLRSPARAVVGIGSAAFAGGGGAIRGTVTDEAGTPVAADLELLAGTGSIPRTADADGRFWFSEVPPGTHQLRVSGHLISVDEKKRELFGALRGDVTDPEGKPLSLGVELEAPDGHVFTTRSERSGALPPIRVPAIGYTLRIPGHAFTATVEVVADAVIGGTLRDPAGRALAGRTVSLQALAGSIAEQATDELGRFRFAGLAAGAYRLTVQGLPLRVVPVAGGRVAGSFPGAPGPVEVELTVDAGAARSTRVVDGEFEIDELSPWTYGLRVDADAVDVTERPS